MSSVVAQDLKHMQPQEREDVLDWLEAMDALGLAAELSVFEKMLEKAPAAAKFTQEYHYLRGLYDGRFLHEELKCKCAK